jgi:hypothetical protein
MPCPLGLGPPRLWLLARFKSLRCKWLTSLSALGHFHDDYLSNFSFCCRVSLLDCCNPLMSLLCISAHGSEYGVISTAFGVWFVSFAFRFPEIGMIWRSGAVRSSSHTHPSAGSLFWHPPNIFPRSYPLLAFWTSFGGWPQACVDLSWSGCERCLYCILLIAAYCILVSYCLGWDCIYHEYLIYRFSRPRKDEVCRNKIDETEYKACLLLFLKCLCSLGEIVPIEDVIYELSHHETDCVMIYGLDEKQLESKCHCDNG